MTPTLRIDLTEAQIRAVLDVIGPVVGLLDEDTDLYQAERILDSALLAREMRG